MTELLLSIHDVTPALAADVETLWTLCAAHGATPALLVVPDWHGRWPLEAHRAFVDRLHGWSAAGADVLLHGLRHDEVGSPRRWADAARAVGRTAREGEFLTLDRDAAAARIREGLTRLRTLGLSPCGFVPPAWLMRPGCVDAVASAGLALTEDADALYVVRAARGVPRPAVARVRAPVWRWSGRTPLRAWASAAVVAGRRAAADLRAPALLRVALHPADLAHPATRRSVERTLGTLAGRVRWRRYGSLARSGGPDGG